MELVQHFTCPITRSIFKNPVLLVQDNIVYEKEAIENWLNNNKTSPITRTVIPKNYDLIRLINYENIIEAMLTANPELASEQYKPIKKHRDNREEFETIINNNSYNDIKNFVEFDINLILENYPHILFYNLETTEYILENNKYQLKKEIFHILFELYNSKPEYVTYKFLFIRYLKFSNNDHIFNNDIILDAINKSNFDIIKNYKNFDLNKLCDYQILINLCKDDPEHIKCIKYLMQFEKTGKENLTEFLFDSILYKDASKFLFFQQLFNTKFTIAEIEKIIVNHEKFDTINFDIIINSILVIGIETNTKLVSSGYWNFFNSNNSDRTNKNLRKIIIKYYDTIKFEYGLVLFKYMLSYIFRNFRDFEDKKNIKYFYASNIIKQYMNVIEPRLFPLIDNTVINDILNLDLIYHNDISSNEDLIKEILLNYDFLPNIPLKWLLVYIKYGISNHYDKYFELIKNNKQFLNDNLGDYDIISDDYDNFKKYFDIFNNFEYIDKILINKKPYITDIINSHLSEETKINIMTNLLSSDFLTKKTYIVILEYYPKILNQNIINKALKKILRHEIIISKEKKTAYENCVLIMENTIDAIYKMPQSSQNFLYY
ncbi:U-box domain protein [Hokovirus HKV1]|uniref:U-box domain protein n=1 Tax=Hokovirus HKV1 TaxID=1977638 RepID=A0A1V0SF43_9VIRU|nr:U-box domain protein [Hokovirus HKV1]